MPLPYTLDELCAASSTSSRPTASPPATSAPSPCAATAKSASAPRARRSRSTSPTSPGANTCRARRRGRLHLQLEPPRAQHHARARQGRRQLHELAAHPHGSRHQRLRRGHRARRQRPGQRRLRREHLRRPQRRALHPAAGQLRALRHHPRLRAHHRPPPRLTVVEQALPRELLYIADEVFFTGTAAEGRPSAPSTASWSATASPGEITKKIADEFFGIANGLKPDRFGWLTPVAVATPGRDERLRPATASRVQRSTGAC
jgi:hypothetical protein